MCGWCRDMHTASLRQNCSSLTPTAVAHTPSTPGPSCTHLLLLHARLCCCDGGLPCPQVRCPCCQLSLQVCLEPLQLRLLGGQPRLQRGQLPALTQRRHLGRLQLWGGGEKGGGGEAQTVDGSLVW
jgi:hypothetical protein